MDTGFKNESVLTIRRDRPGRHPLRAGVEFREKAVTLPTSGFAGKGESLTVLPTGTSTGKAFALPPGEACVLKTG
jgi:hypothetical protein